ncbi:MAG: hypothetical protein KC708_04980 [Anaerolineae bacterium]|nr:hypothetical protein [Anaerolineae bacterium]
MSFAEAFPHLKYFFSVHFHQFWLTMHLHSKDLEAEWDDKQKTYEIHVIDFKMIVDSKRVSATISELETLINMRLTEEELRTACNRELGSFVYPPGLGLTYQEWLENILALLKSDIDR